MEKTVQNFLKIFQENLNNKEYNIENDFYWVDSFDYPSIIKSYANTFYNLLKNITNENILSMKISFGTACSFNEKPYHIIFLKNNDIEFEIIIKNRKWYMINSTEKINGKRNIITFLQNYKNN